MRLLKLTLYTVLMLCIIWGATVALGPKALLFLVERQVGSKLKITNLKISPQLEITASRIDFKNISLGATEEVIGYARAVSLSVDDFLVMKPIIRASLGPTKINGSTGFNSLTFAVKPNLSDLNSLGFDIVASSFNVDGSAEVESIEASGKFLREQMSVENFVFTINELGLDGYKTTSIGQINGGAAQLTFADRSFYTPDLKLDLKNIYLGDGQLQSDSVSVSGTVGADYFQIFLKANNFQPPDKSFHIGQFLVGIEGKNLSLFDWQSITAELGELTIYQPRFSDEAVSFSGVYSVIENMGDGFVSIKAEGLTDEIEIINNSSFIADLPGMEFKIWSADLIDTNRPSIPLSFGIRTDVENGMNASGSVLLKISEPKLKGCFIASCGIEDVSWTYEIVVDGEPLRGASRCFSNGCSDSSARHSLETLNTEKLFSIISKKNFLNPFVLALVYREFISSPKVGTGHLLEF